jgi:PAS domain S-box-containing protein
MPTAMPGSSEQKSRAGERLRARAEEQVTHEDKQLSRLSREAVKQTLHELRVHQVELEMQNDELRVAQSELESARERYAELYDYAPVGYLTLSELGNIQEANLTSATLLGIERSRLLSMPFSRFVIPEDQETYYLCWRGVFSRPQRIRACEVRLRPVGPPTFHARLESVAAEVAGTPVCRLTISDITEQKRAEQSLRENERRHDQAEHDERMRLALETGDLGAWDQDLRTGRIICSERARAILFFPPEVPVTPEGLMARLSPDDRAHFRRELERSAAPPSSGPVELVFRIVLPDGSVRWVRFVSQCLFPDSGAGRPVRRTGVLADITRQKETEALLESRARQLEVLVRERTGRLQEAVAELEHFSYTLAHDLRAPLRAIRGYTELLLSESAEVSPTHKQFLERTNFAAERMDQLIMDALNYNRLVRQHFPLQVVDCGPLFDQLLSSYPQFQEARESIRVVNPLPLVLGNPALLTQCFSNLLQNALKFVPAGRPPSVRIITEEIAARVRIWFEDNGIGIAEDCQEKIFRMFERLDESYEGTGIGLALVKKSAERMHGTVGVQSHPGQGSRFWLELDRPESVPSP